MEWVAGSRPDRRLVRKFLVRLAGCQTGSGVMEYSPTGSQGHHDESSLRKLHEGQVSTSLTSHTLASPSKLPGTGGMTRTYFFTDATKLREALWGVSLRLIFR